MPGTSMETPFALRRLATFPTETWPLACNSAETTPTGVSIFTTPGETLPRCASEATSPMVPWPHMPR